MGELQRSKTVNRIIHHGLEEQATLLLVATPKLSLEQVAQQLNAIAGLDDDSEDKITKKVVYNFQRNNQDARREVLLADRDRRRKAVMEGVEFDMLKILKDTAARLTFMMDTYEQEALENGTIPDPKAYKALTSELRETLKQIEAIHAKVYDMEVVRAFLDDVIKTLKDVSPDALAEFVERMKLKRDNDHVVSEILKGGMGR